jgi:hypothetical protein
VWYIDIGYQRCPGSTGVTVNQFCGELPPKNADSFALSAGNVVSHGIDRRFSVRGTP